MTSRGCRLEMAGCTPLIPRTAISAWCRVQAINQIQTRCDRSRTTHSTPMSRLLMTVTYGGRAKTPTHQPMPSIGAEMTGRKSQKKKLRIRRSEERRVGKEGKYG